MDLQHVKKVITEASPPKVPGLSPQRFKAIIEKVKADIVESATDPYNGARWNATWRVTKGEAHESGQWQYDPIANVRSKTGTKTVVYVEEAKFVSASGGMDERHTASLYDAGGFRGNSQQNRDIIQAIGPIIATLLSRQWTGKAWFAYFNGDHHTQYGSASKVGDTFDVDSDEFERYGVQGAIKSIHGCHGVEVPVRMKVRASFTKDGLISYRADFTA